jgi:endonuclease/exonuclease/phosphatase (EEP) superfamily protein YafD
MPSVLKALVKAGLVIGAVLTLIGLMARWFPALDIVNNGLPFLLAGTLIVAPRRFRAKRAIDCARTSPCHHKLHAFHPRVGRRGARCRTWVPRFLRVVTFNVWHHNDNIEKIAQFLSDTDADLVVMEEMTGDHWSKLREMLRSRYHYSLGDYGIVILSKYKITEDGRVDRGGMPAWSSLLLRFGKIEVNGTQVTFAGAHLARPFYPRLQYTDVVTLANFVRQQHGPLILAGDFNMTPWTDKLTGFTQATGLKRYNTFHFTWPLKARGITLMPFVAIDHVFASPDFANIATRGGPRLCSDHRPIIADIALAPKSK